jgi:hypothetical protein
MRKCGGGWACSTKREAPNLAAQMIGKPDWSDIDKPGSLAGGTIGCISNPSRFPRPVPFVSARDATTHGRVVGKTGITTRWHSHFLRRVVKNRNRSSEATLPPRRASSDGCDYSSLTGSNSP